MEVNADSNKMRQKKHTHFTNFREKVRMETAGYRWLFQSKISITLTWLTISMLWVRKPKQIIVKYCVLSICVNTKRNAVEPFVTKN